jgi:hypothetical protein
MLKQVKFLLAAGALALGVTFARPAQAALSNGGFETGDLTSWSSIGNASVQDSTYGVVPPEGKFQGLLTTGDSSLSNGAGGPAVLASQLDTFLGLAAGTLEGMGGGATNGSAMKQTFSATAGDVISFKWDFLTRDSGGLDFGFFMLQPQIPAPTILATSSNAVNPSLTVFSNETGYQTTGPIVIGVTGTYTISFGVVNTGDTLFNSGLLVDAVTQNGSTGPINGGVTVPLPAAAYVAPLGLLLAAMASKRLRKLQAA